MPPLVYLVLGFLPSGMKETNLAWRWHQRVARTEANIKRAPDTAWTMLALVTFGQALKRITLYVCA